MNIIISGMSGAGKTAALKALEDFGFLCVDNILPKFLPEIIFSNEEAAGRRDLAIVTDLRGGEFFNEIYSVLDKLKMSGVSIKLIFLDAADDALVNRFKEKRREHILSKGGLIEEGIALERKALAHLKARADTVLDTSGKSERELKQFLSAMLGEGGGSVHVVSFGFKRGTPQADYLLDVRFAANPYEDLALRSMNGLQSEVADYVLSSPLSEEFLENLKRLVLPLIPVYHEAVCPTMIVAFGCTGGRHRSVAFAESFALRLKNCGINVTISHRDIYID